MNLAAPATFQKAPQGEYYFTSATCPSRQTHLVNNEESPTFTGEFLTGLARCFNSQGIAGLSLDIRKLCRRNHRDTRCPPIAGSQEQSVLALATMVELLIARNVFGINVQSTLTFGIKTSPRWWEKRNAEERERLKSMSPEERARHNAKQREQRRQWSSKMSPEQRRRFNVMKRDRKLKRLVEMSPEKREEYNAK
ncbi:hypothetical protein BHE90_003407 [Fusarium euwallaceae]|uniref:Uncharacterized protein n=1 Tax=Fusarium euwallaceae TaxID=1147111 RepID=A0A430M266_9HYPO|nr:hypothetical protein BHE90_003407 [Fusarium euwallaceae]